MPHSPSPVVLPCEEAVDTDPLSYPSRGRKETQVFLKYERKDFLQTALIFHYIFLNTKPKFNILKTTLHVCMF